MRLQKHTKFLQHNVDIQCLSSAKGLKSILYDMTSERIKTKVSNGYPPVFLLDTNDQRQQIGSIQQQISKMNSEDRWPVEQDIYTVFFQALPYIIEKNIDSFWEGMLQHF
jgi:hypothetical protein